MANANPLADPRERAVRPTATRVATRRGLLGAAMVGGGAFTAAACGQSSGGEAGGYRAGAAPTGTVQFWHWGTGYNDGFDVLTKEFNARGSGVTIERPPAASGYWDKLTSALAGNVGPDAFLMNDNARTWANKGLLRPLDDLLKKDRAAETASQQVLQAFREWYLVDGKQTGLGWDYSTIATAYNLAHLQEVGLKPPSELGDKWDWTAYREYAQKLTRPGARWGAYANPSDETGWLNFARANGGDYFSADRTRCTVGSPACIEAVEFLVGLVQKDRYAPTRAEASAGGGAVQLFVDGQLAVGTFGDWSFKDFEKKSGGTLRWDAAPVPFKNGKTGSTANLRGLCLNPATRVLDAAFEWLKFALTRPVQDRIPTLFGEVPSRLDAAQDVYLNPDKAGPPRGRPGLKPSILATKSYPSLDRVPTDDFYNVVTPLINDAWDAKISVKDALTRAQDQVTALIQQSKG